MTHLSDRRVFLLGIDGLPPKDLFRFLDLGAAPKLARWLDGACTFDMEPTLPALTAPGWMCIASGAHPSTLGIENILLPKPGTVPSEIDNGFDSRLVRAETLWQAFGRQGLPSIVFKYPGSWPPLEGDFLQVDGAGGYADITCAFEWVSSRAYVSVAPAPAEIESGDFVFPTGYKDNWRIDTGSTHSQTAVVVRDPVGWLNLTPSVEPAFEFVVHQEHRNVPLLGLACQCDGQPTLFLTEGKDLNRTLAQMTVGQWSPFLDGGAGERVFKYRFRLQKLDLANRMVHLYRSEGHGLHGYTKPNELAQELLETVGPPVEWTGTFDVMNGLIDLDTQLDIYRQHTQYMADVIRYLGRQKAWRGFFMHWHVAEYAHHMVGASLTTDHPRHDASVVDRDLQFLCKTYDLLDLLVEAVDDISDENTMVVLASDHGHDLVHSLFYVNQFLAERGWLVLNEDGRNREIDWSKSVAYGLFPGFIYINERGRWSAGSVPSTDVPNLVQEISDGLRSLVDPTTGRRAVTHVLDRAELLPYGLSGPRAPDMFFAMDRGYEVATRFSAQSMPLFEITEPLTEVTSGHGSFHPKSSSARTIAAFRGPDIPERSRGRYPGHVVDIAPTIAEWLGIEPPRDCDGRPLNFARTVEK